MFKIILFGLFVFIGSINAKDLVLKKGEIKAHTGIFGDSNIDLISNNIRSNLTIDHDISSIKGDLSIPTLSLISENTDRDEHMYELLENNSFSTISFYVNNVHQLGNKYIVNGILNLHGVKKEIASSAILTKKNNQLIMDGNFTIKLTQFNLEPPSLLFFTVRDDIDINYKLYYDVK